MEKASNLKIKFQTTYNTIRRYEIEKAAQNVERTHNHLARNGWKYRQAHCVAKAELGKA